MISKNMKMIVGFFILKVFIFIYLLPRYLDEDTDW